MASLDLLPRKVFEITLGDGKKITGQFGTWTLKRFCDKSKLSLKHLNDKFVNEGTNLTDTVSMLLCAVEYVCLKNKEPFTYTDIEACDWIDELGGVYSIPVSNLFNHAASELKDEAPDSEKKSPLNGQTFNAPSQEQEVV